MCTWTSPDGKYWNQIDYFLCSQRWRSSIQLAKTRPEADYGSDWESQFLGRLIRSLGVPKEEIGVWGFQSRDRCLEFSGGGKDKVFCLHSFSSVQFSSSVVSNSLWPHESQHARPPCPSRTPGVHSDSCPSSQWCHPAISSFVVPFSSRLQSLQHQSLFQWVNSSHEVAKILEFQL